MHTERQQVAVRPIQRASGSPSLTPTASPALTVTGTTATIDDLLLALARRLRAETGLSQSEAHRLAEELTVTVSRFVLLWVGA